jgi:hypothetical protein
MIATDYDLTNALWLYAIGAISKAELYRFRFGAERKPTDWELSIDPLHLTWVKHCEAAKHIMSILDAHFPIPGPALSKILCKDSKAKGPWRHNAYHTQYEGQKTFDREACQFLCDRWFERSSQEADEFYRMPPLKQLYAYLRNERNYSESFPELPPIYLWHRLSDNDFDDVRTGYQNGMYDARQIRKLLFNDSVVEKKRNELSDPPAKALIPSIAYEDAIAKIEDAFKYVNQITAKGLARALGLPLNSVEDMKRRTTAWKRQSIRADEAKLIIDIAFNRCYGIK